ncbi:alkaline phosphatase PhoX [Halorientalis marina]|uniref:alkaline phosphatase PhoX n=1 Tax=Halorientalis marina TaxID=2931976 RepID=UPI001FF2A576|nr:alkaline phosphatase PhoX [Halorientalis marina]
MVGFDRRSLMKTSVAAAVGAGVTGIASAQDDKDRDARETDDSDGQTAGAPSVEGSLKRFSTTAFGAEMTGPFVFADGTLLHSIQHPDRRNPEPYDRAGVGYYSGFAFEFDGDNDDFAEPSPPEGEQQDYARAANADFEYLIREGDEINGGEERWGITQTPDGTDVTTDNFAGTTYGPSGYNPDCNQFVPTNDAGTEGYLFTNDENSPGNVMRTPIRKTDDGEWVADAENAINTVNTEPFREIGGTRINCYGDLSPWETMISSEENYAHPRVSLRSTVSDAVEAGTGEGIYGANHFWNRPNPNEINSAVNDSYDEVDGWYVQGYWATDGVEHLAYYLGADPVEAGDGNPIEPIGDIYPNPYRYGYHVDIREPTADPPQPVKYYVMGRASWEAPDLLPDEKTVYGCSDGDSKGIYKFVADEPIPSYDDPMDVEGTLYAPKITNDAASSGRSPAEVPLDVEWMPLGHASNREVESWIAEYDDVTQVDYLESHTDWTEGDAVTEDVLKQADLEVIENGNQDYISDEEIVEWADQYEAEGPDGVDDELRKVPFLETRAAAKEIGASIEFNKAEGVDSMDDAAPGDFIYFGISEFNDALDDQPSNDGGDIALDRVDGGVVYRAELDSDYDVSRLEPVIVGPDFTEEEAMADVDGALRNVDNVYTMRDGRVLCCEDGWRGANRSYPNDGLFVYQPPVSVDVESAAIRNGESAELELTAHTLPAGFSGARVTVEVTQPDVAEIADASYADALGVSAEPEVAGDGSAITVRAADIENAVEPGDMNVTLATLEVEGTGAGTTDLRVNVEDMDDEAGADIEAQERSGIVITGPPAIGGAPGGRPPTDPDGDGFYEDVNGNGRMDYDDVTLLFEEFESDAVTMNVDAYDFNENGQLDYDDVVDLYEEIN